MKGDAMTKYVVLAVVVFVVLVAVGSKPPTQHEVALQFRDRTATFCREHPGERIPAGFASAGERCYAADPVDPAVQAYRDAKAAFEGK
jgi:hypothetical protein